MEREGCANTERQTVTVLATRNILKLKTMISRSHRWSLLIWYHLCLHVGRDGIHPWSANKVKQSGKIKRKDLLLMSTIIGVDGHNSPRDSSLEKVFHASTFSLLSHMT